MNKKVDIIIPVYNAYEFTKKCVETVIKNTDLTYHTLVLINDKSPDEKIAPMLVKVKEENKNLNIVVLENEKNCGFVKTVNVGMKYSDNDVVLLNSDTEVTPNWLEKMQKTAYIQTNVATVTPLSNNATLASVPNFLYENKLPEGVSLEEYAKTIEECSFEEYPELSTAHGFCMYIRRDAIEKVGLFDDATFEKGYGEENDFSFRCLRNGLVNLLCDNVYIYHKGEQSFVGAKAELSKSHTKILEEKYPKNCEMNTSLCLNNPYSYIQENVKYNVGNKFRKNILIVAHEFFKKERKLVGGTVLHIYDLIENLRSEMNFHVLFQENGQYRVRSFFEDSTSEVVLGRVVSYEDYNLRNLEYKKTVKKVFDFIKVDFVHIHHLMYHYFDIVDLVREKKIPYAVSIHDYYFVCPTFALLENGEKYCANIEKPDCEGCIKRLKNIEDKDFLDLWRKNCYDVLKDAELVITPSNSTKEIMNKFYTDLKIKVVEHGMDMLPEYENIDTTNKRNKKRIAFLGGINKVKGIDFLKDFIEDVNKKESDMELHLFGNTSDELLNKSNGNYIFHGMYARKDIRKLLNENNIDLVLFLSIVPETYSYTLTETAMSEIPVLALNYGALAERITNDDLGWVIDANSNYQDVLKMVKQILENTEEYNKKIENIKKYVASIRTASDMACDYKEIYIKYLKNNSDFIFNLDKNEFLNMLKFTKEICQNEEEFERLYHSMSEYHNTVMSERKEIERLNNLVNDYKQMEQKYNHLISSRKLNLLRKLKIIEF